MKEIKIIVKQATTKEGRKFNYYQGVMKNGKLAKIKFTRGIDVNKLPTHNFILVTDNISQDKSYQYPTFWVRSIFDIKEIEQAHVIEETDLF